MLAVRPFPGVPWVMSDSLDFDGLRRLMVEAIEVHARTAGPETGRPELSRVVLDVMAAVPRHEFVPTEMRTFAYFDTPLPIGFGKTISQTLYRRPHDGPASGPAGAIAFSTSGPGLGYQAAVLARIASRVYSVEIIEELARSATRRLAGAKGAGTSK